jgi:hypothetical protein
MPIVRLVAQVAAALVLGIVAWFCHATSLERAHEIVNGLPSNSLEISRKWGVFVKELTPRNREFIVSGVNYVIKAAWLERKVLPKQSFFATSIDDTGQIVLCLRLRAIHGLSPDRVEQLQIASDSEMTSFFAAKEFSMHVGVGSSTRPFVEISDKQRVKSIKVFFE